MRESIDTIIDALAEKLPIMLDHVRDDRTFILGRELLLGGFKKFHGETIDPLATYQMDVPVVKGEIVDGTVSPKIIDHKRLLKLAWLRNGLPGLYSYLAPYLTAEQLTTIKDYFMKAK